MSVSAGISVRPPIGVTVSATVVDVDTVWVGCVRASTYVHKNIRMFHALCTMHSVAILNLPQSDGR